MTQEPVSFSDNIKLHWLILGIVFAIPFLIYYAVENPNSVVAKVFFIEPSYIKMRKGFQLMEGFESYSSLEDVTYDLKQRGVSSRVSSRLLTTTPQKPYVLQTMEVSGYVYQGNVGHLKAIFFNDRLSGVQFFPNDPDDMRTILMQQYKKRIDLNKKLKISTYINLRYFKEKDDRYVFSWEDRRLVAEELAWLMRNT